MVSISSLLCSSTTCLGYAHTKTSLRPLTIDQKTGFSLASGVLQSYYLAHEDEFDGDISNVAIIGTTVTVS